MSDDRSHWTRGERFLAALLDRWPTAVAVLAMTGGAVIGGFTIRAVIGGGLIGVAAATAALGLDWENHKSP
jgi:hypothetical protein